jgi:hypothetical protein
LDPSGLSSPDVAARFRSETLSKNVSELEFSACKELSSKSALRMLRLEGLTPSSSSSQLVVEEASLLGTRIGVMMHEGGEGSDEVSGI